MDTELYTGLEKLIKWWENFINYSALSCGKIHEVNSVRGRHICSYYRGVNPLQQWRHGREELRLCLPGSWMERKRIQMGRRQDETLKQFPQWPISSSEAPPPTFHGLAVMPSYQESITGLTYWWDRALKIKSLPKSLSAGMESPPCLFGPVHIQTLTEIFIQTKLWWCLEVMVTMQCWMGMSPDVGGDSVCRKK